MEAGATLRAVLSFLEGLQELCSTVTSLPATRTARSSRSITARSRRRHQSQCQWISLAYFQRATALATLFSTFSDCAIAVATVAALSCSSPPLKTCKVRWLRPQWCGTCERWKCGCTWFLTGLCLIPTARCRARRLAAFKLNLHRRASWRTSARGRILRQQPTSGSLN